MNLEQLYYLLEDFFERENLDKSFLTPRNTTIQRMTNSECIVNVYLENKDVEITFIFKNEDQYKKDKIDSEKDIKEIKNKMNEKAVFVKDLFK